MAILLLVGVLVLTGSVAAVVIGAMRLVTGGPL